MLRHHKVLYSGAIRSGVHGASAHKRLPTHVQGTPGASSLGAWATPGTAGGGRGTDTGLGMGAPGAEHDYFDDAVCFGMPGRNVAHAVGVDHGSQRHWCRAYMKAVPPGWSQAAF